MKTYHIALLAFLLAGCQLNLTNPIFNTNATANVKAKVGVKTETQASAAKPVPSVQAGAIEEREISMPHAVTSSLPTSPSPKPTPQTVPQLVSQISGTKEELRAIYFVNQNVGYVAGRNGTLLKTTNGGGTWKSISKPELNEIDFNRLYFINEEQGWLGDSHNGRLTLFKTEDGGETWSELPELPLMVDGPIKFIDALHGYAGGYSPAMTEDGGNTWTQFTGVDYRDSLSCVDGVVILSGGSGISRLEPGEGWIQVAGAFTQSTTHFDFVSTLEGWLVEGTTLSHTTDGGATFKPVGTLGAVVNQIRFFPDGRGTILTAYGSLLLVNLNGATVTFKSLSLPSENFEELYMLDSYTGWVVGADGAIIKYIAPKP